MNAEVRNLKTELFSRAYSAGFRRATTATATSTATAFFVFVFRPSLDGL